MQTQFIHKLIVKRNISTFFTLGLIRSISTVIFMVTLEFLWDTFPIPAGEFPCFTCSYNERKKKEKTNLKSYFFPVYLELVFDSVFGQLTAVFLISSVSAVVRTVTPPEIRFTETIFTLHLKLVAV